MSFIWSWHEMKAGVEIALDGGWEAGPGMEERRGASLLAELPGGDMADSSLSDF